MTTITHGTGSATASILTDERAVKNKLAKLMDANPNAATVEVDHNGMTSYIVPWSWIILKQPKRLSAETRAEMAEHMRNVEKKRKIYNN